MVSVDDALDRILRFFAPLSPVQMPIIDALGMVLARNVIANEDIPPFRNSAMDGFAVRVEDTLTAPATLNVVASVAAGDAPGSRVQAGQAIRIMTGAPLPDGADAVVRFEETDELRRGLESGSIQISRAARAHENIRDAGEDLRHGQRALAQGTRLRPAEIGVLASLNEATVAVYRRPRVAILSTGDEVVDLGDELRPGQIRNSNSYTIAAMVRRFGGEPLLLGIARDTSADLRSKLKAGGNPDLYVTSGGVSLGDYDMVKDVLKAQGSIDIWQVRMKPGKPLAFGTISGTPLIGLPGNPAAALVSFEQFGRPALLTMLGRRDVMIPETSARLTERIENRGQRRNFVRGILTRQRGEDEVRTGGRQGASMLSAVVQSNCFIVVPETSGVLEPGTMVRVQLPDEGL